MPLARHDFQFYWVAVQIVVSTHMPLARHDDFSDVNLIIFDVSTHMPLARHDKYEFYVDDDATGFYSHASCEA